MTVKPAEDEQTDEHKMRTITDTIPGVLCRFPARNPGKSVRVLTRGRSEERFGFSGKEQAW
jgi:hypothetical protein